MFSFFSKEFNHDSEYLKDKSVFICMYKQNYELTLPYITYYLTANDNILQFQNMQPFTDEQSRSTMEEPEDDAEYIMPHEEEDTILREENIDLKEGMENLREQENPSIYGGGDDILFDQCSRYIQNIFENNSNISYEQYKGFIESDDGNIYTFFDITKNEINNENIERFVPCIIDEIIRSMQINGKQISDNVSLLFNNEKQLCYMINQHEVLIYKPIIVYLCENNHDNEIVNSVYETENSQSVSLVGDETEHPIVGTGHLFTNSIIDQSIANRVKRFVLFNYNAVHVLHEPFDINDYELVADESCISFLSNGREYWSTKNINMFTPLQI